MDAPPIPAVAAIGLTRLYGNITALNSLDLTINQGDLFGFIGSNGAGKTTTLKMLSGLLYPSHGSARVLGYVPWERQDGYRRQFALLLGQKNQLWWDLPAIESFLLLRHIYGLGAAQYRTTLDELVTLLDVGHKLNVMVRELSLGERMKMELIAALLHRPRVLFLDEPTIGLDVVSQKAVRLFLRDYNRRYHTTILLTSHYMADIKALCERVIVIHKGRKIHDGAIDQLDATGSRQKIIKFRPVDGVLSPGALDSRFGQPKPTEDGEYVLHVPGEQAVAVSQQILAAGPVADITIEDVPLEDIIAELFGKQK
jgi:ABC-2 type transport system ATP-binding protein